MAERKLMKLTNTGKILVTGGDGLVGEALKRLNLNELIFVGHKDADLTKFDETLKLFQTLQPVKVIHLAARVGGIGGNLAHPGSFYMANMLMNTNVLECARLVGVQKLVSFLSTCVYPDNATLPLREEMIHDGPPHPSNFGYAYAKRMLDVQSRAYRKEYGCNFVTVIPTNLYGPNDKWNIEEGHVIPSLIHKCFLAKKNAADFIVWGSGEPLREFLYSGDGARLVYWALNNYEEETPINLTTGKETKIEDLVNIIVTKMNFTGNVVWDRTKPDGQYNKPADTSKLNKYVHDFKFMSIEQGIEKTVSWFLTNYPNIRM